MLNFVKQLFRRNRATQHGQGLVEYALILALVAVVVITGLSFTGRTVASAYCVTSSALGADTSTVDFCSYIEAKAICKQTSGVLELTAYFNADGGRVKDTGLGITASPGGDMTRTNKKYTTSMPVNGECPASVTFRATNGYARTVDVKIKKNQ